METVYIVTEFGYSDNYGEYAVDNKVFCNYQAAKEYFENLVNSKIEEDFYKQKESEDSVLLFSNEDKSWVEIKIEEKECVSEEKKEYKYEFNYKCFSVVAREGYVLIKDEFGDIIDYLPWMSEKEVKEHIDKYFKCE